MIKEKINMELRARILLVISISSLILYLSVEGINILPSIAQPVSKLDEGNQLDKHQGSRVLDEPKKASRHPLGPTPKAQKSSGSASSPGSGQEKKALNPTTLWGGISGVLEEAEKTIAPVTSSIVNEAEAVSSSIFGLGTHAPSQTPSFSGPVPYPNSPAPHPNTYPISEHAPLSNSPSSRGTGLGPTPSPFSGPVPYPNLFSSSPGSDPLPPSSPFPGPVPYPNLPSPSPDSNPLPGPFPGPVPYPNSPSSSPGSVPVPSPAPGFFDHDIALAIEARIKQSQSDSQLAMDEAKKLLKDPKIASSETGVCLSKCVDKYSASLNKLNRAITDLGARHVTLLADDFGAVETDINTCQACFTENRGEDSPLKALEEATAKAARECLTVMDYAA